MSVEMEVEIFGLGKDSFTLEGTVLVHRGNGAGPDGAVMTGDLAGAELRGESKVFGKLVAIESPLQNSICEYKWLAAKKYDGYFDINGWFFLPKHDLVFFTKKPVRVAGPTEAIPPIGQVADAANVPVELFDFRKPGAPPAGSLIKARGKTLSEVNIEERLKEKGETVVQLKS